MEVETSDLEDQFGRAEIERVMRCGQEMGMSEIESVIQNGIESEGRRGGGDEK